MKKIALLLLLLVTDSAFGQQVGFSSVPVAFPQIAVGGDPGSLNYVTLIQIVNNNSFGTTAHLALFSDSGAPLPVIFDGQAASQSTLDFTVQSGATRQIQLTLNGIVTAGWMQITYTPSDAQTQVILQYRSGTTLLSEIGVQPAFSGMTGTFFAAETDIGLDTGIAVANPGTAAANVLARVWNPADGTVLASTTISLPANGHVAKFLDQLFPSALNITQIRAQVSLDACSDTTCTAAGTGGFLATALRLNGSQYTTIPVISRPNGGDLIRVLPQVAIGGPSGGINYNTILYLTTDQAAGVSGTIDIFDDNGNPLPASANGAAQASSIPFSVLGSRVTRIVLSGGPIEQSGWIRLTMASSVDLIANAVFQTFTGSVLASEAGVLDSPPNPGGVIYVNVQPGFSDVGVAFANSQPTPVTVNLTLFDQSGFVLATKPITLPAFGHVAQYVGRQIFSQQLASLGTFTGALNVDSPVSSSAVALRLTGTNVATLPFGAQGMYRPSITGLSITQILRSQSQVNFSVNVTDFDSDLATSTSPAVMGYAFLDFGPTIGVDQGPISLDGTPMIGQPVGTISGSFVSPDIAPGSIPLNTTATLYINLYDSKGNQSNQVFTGIKFTP
jgi:hypothetical protein